MSASTRDTGPKNISTKILKCSRGRLAAKDLRVIVDAIAAGSVVIFPTDTVYGIGCNAFHPGAIKGVYELKGRHYSKALPILLRSRAQLELVAKEVLPETEKLMEAYWPGALTLVFKTAALALNATGGRSTIAVRVPEHGVVKQILEKVQLPLAATSANQSGKEAMTTFAEVKNEFDGRVDIIVDGGKCRVGEPSSVVDATHYPFSVLREGAIGRRELARKMGLDS